MGSEVKQNGYSILGYGIMALLAISMENKEDKRKFEAGNDWFPSQPLEYEMPV